MDTRIKLKAERTLRQENSDVTALDRCATEMTAIRKLYNQRRTRKRWQRKVSDEALKSARMNLDIAANQVTSTALLPLIDDYHDISGQFAVNAIEVNVETEEASYQAVMQAIGELRRAALDP